MGEMTLADIAAVTDRDNNAFGGGGKPGAVPDRFSVSGQ